MGPAPPYRDAVRARPPAAPPGLRTHAAAGRLRWRLPPRSHAWRTQDRGQLATHRTRHGRPRRPCPRRPGGPPPLLPSGLSRGGGRPPAGGWYRSRQRPGSRSGALPAGEGHGAHRHAARAEGDAGAPRHARADARHVPSPGDGSPPWNADALWCRWPRRRGGDGLRGGATSGRSPRSRCGGIPRTGRSPA